MDGSPGYALEKLSIALRSLATGAGDVRNRLRSAYLTFHPVKERDFPPHLQADWRWVMAQLTRFGPIMNHKGEVGTGSVDHTLSRIKNSTGTKIAEKIFDLHTELESWIRENR